MREAIDIDSQPNYMQIADQGVSPNVVFQDIKNSSVFA